MTFDLVNYQHKPIASVQAHWIPQTLKHISNIQQIGKISSMADQQLDIEEEIERHRLDILYRRSKTASFTLLVISGIYVILLVDKFHWKHLLVWYGGLVIVFFMRLLFARWYFLDQCRTKSMAFWLQLFRFGIFTIGMMMGSLNLLFFPREPLSYVIMAVIIPCGIAVGAVGMLLDFFSFILYVVTLLSPVIFQTVLTGDRLHLGTGILAFILGMFFLKFSKEYNDNFFTNTKLRFENKALLNEIEEEKNKLDNRLGRILNDSTTEIFVADAETLACLQVNQGAIDNLGYTEEEFKDINFLDIFSDLDKPRLRELIAPLSNGRWKPVIHKGINRRKDGTTFPVEASIQLSTVDTPPIIVANVQDITDREKWEERLIYQANYDQLTGLFNRHYIQSYMHSVFSRARRQQKRVALLFLDLDHFKNINDNLGHDTGDEVLKETAYRISTLLRDSDIAARTGGDEFTIFLENLEKSSQAEIVANKLVEAFQQPFRVKNQDVYTSVSLGISIYPDDGDSHEQLMQCADIAMYQAKQDGRNMYRFFSMEMRRSSEMQILISNQLRFALAKDELTLVYQPKIDISKGQIVGAEALLRWHNPELGDVSPAVFIPLAENLGIIHELGKWVLLKACQEAVQWQERTSEQLKISVNVSPQQFRTGSLLEDVDNALKISGLPNSQLELEITETLLMQDSDKPLVILDDLHRQGVSLALDDFGTGYSSLSYLRSFPLQVLKIDRSFIRDLESDQNCIALVDAIIAMAQSLGLETVAEGVENEKQLDFLRQRNVNIIQGYLFSPPVPAEKFHELLATSIS